MLFAVVVISRTRKWGEIKVENDIVIVPVKVKVCMGCGERYYDREMMKMLEDVEDKIEKRQLKFELIGIGKVLKVAGKASK